MAARRRPHQPEQRLGGCTPQPVLRAMIDHLLSAEEFREAPYPWFGYEENTRLRELRDALAAFLRVKRDELAIVRNATEANNAVRSEERRVGKECRSRETRLTEQK